MTNMQQVKWKIKTGKIKINSVISALIAISMLLYALRGKFGAGMITVLIVLLLVEIIRNKLKKGYINVIYAIFLLFFAVIMHAFRSLSFEYYLFIGYVAASMVLFNNNLQMYSMLWKVLQIIAVFEASGVYLQRFFPVIYYAIMSCILPADVVSSIHNRLSEGYYTGFTREVSYTMFLIAIGLGLYIFDFRNKKENLISMSKFRIIIILFLFGALFISGKRATLLFFILVVFFILFLHSRDKLKVLKYLLMSFGTIILVWLTFPIWSKIPALSRIVELINYVTKNDMVGITNGRTVIYEMAITLWSEKKWFGIGWGNFKYLTPKDVWYSGFDVHNCFLQILCENGILGAALFYGLTVITVVNAIRCVLKAKYTRPELYKMAIIAGYIQLFFVSYSITEPILYEYTDYIIYFVSINVTNIILKKLRLKQY